MPQPILLLNAVPSETPWKNTGSMAHQSGLYSLSHHLKGRYKYKGQRPAYEFFHFAFCVYSRPTMEPA